MPSHVDWDWPRMQDVDENAHADAADKKLKNMTGSYKDEFGPDWKQKLEQIKNEIQWCKENHLPHPSYSMVSGGERSGADDASMAE